MQVVLGPKVLNALEVHVSTLTGRSLFPALIPGPFGYGLRFALLLAAALWIRGAVLSRLRGADPEIEIRETVGSENSQPYQESEAHCAQGRSLGSKRDGYL